MDEKPAEPPKTAPDQPPQALVEFMMKGWKETGKRRFAKVPNAARHAARRARLSAAFPGEVLVIPTGHECIRANDTVYRFRPGSDFFWLTGNKEPDCVLVMEPKEAGGHRTLLFAEPEVDRSTPAFFTDRARGALWVGPRLGLAGTGERYGVDAAIGLPQLGDHLKAIAREAPRLRTLRGLSSPVDRALPADPERDAGLAKALSDLRLLKDPSEITALKDAIGATRLAFDDALRALRTARTEREVEAAFDASARLTGDSVGYSTIVACGEHACILHWTQNDGQIDRKKLVLIDAGVEGESVYTADVTRTVPASGRFSPAQRELYDLVIDAQDAAIAAVKPGNDFVEPHRAAMAVLAHGMRRLGILGEPAEEALREDRQTYKRYTLHNTSHMLGLDVHDGSATAYRQGKLVAGMVLTIEPGLYFQPDDLTVPAKFRGIGIRVEEDVLVTAKGCEVLTRGIPRRSDEIEAWMKKVSKRR